MNKGGCILVNDLDQIGLVYRKKLNDYSFPKGHIEVGETLHECALRETEEETGRRCHLISNDVLSVIEYENYEGKINAYMFLAKDDGPSEKTIDDKDKEQLIWVNFDEVYNLLTYDDLKEFWKEMSPKIKDIIKNNKKQ